MRKNSGTATLPITCENSSLAVWYIGIKESFPISTPCTIVVGL
ncbi:MAG: hypothetical protein Q4F46_05065 [Parabacteroides sp.]|nr:hypothetical protein [Parabacteroides sp.]MDO5428295.1 hypothetical protein [Parabacteroides sp.]